MTAEIELKDNAAIELNTNMCSMLQFKFNEEEVATLSYNKETKQVEFIGKADEAAMVFFDVVGRHLKDILEKEYQRGVNAHKEDFDKVILRYEKYIETMDTVFTDFKSNSKQN